MSKLNAHAGILKKKSQERPGGERAKKEILGLEDVVPETKQETITETLSETKQETAIAKGDIAKELTPLFEERITAEKTRKRQTYFMDSEEIKMVEKMAKKLNRKKFEVVASSVRMMYEEFLKKQGEKKNERKII